MTTQPMKSGAEPQDGLKNPSSKESNKGCLVVSVMILLAFAATIGIVLLVSPGQQ